MDVAVEALSEYYSRVEQAICAHIVWVAMGDPDSIMLSVPFMRQMFGRLMDPVTHWDPETSTIALVPRGDEGYTRHMRRDR